MEGVNGLCKKTRCHGWRVCTGFENSSATSSPTKARANYGEAGEGICLRVLLRVREIVF